MIEGSGSGSVSVTNGSGFGRTKNMWILRIRNRIRSATLADFNKKKSLIFSTLFVLWSQGIEVSISLLKRKVEVLWKFNFYSMTRTQCCGSASVWCRSCHFHADPELPNKGSKPWESAQTGSHSIYFGLSSATWCGSGSSLSLWCKSGSYLSLWVVFGSYSSFWIKAQNLEKVLK